MTARMPGMVTEVSAQGEALGARQAAALEEGHALADVALAGEEDQDVAAVGAEEVDGVGHAAGEVVVLRVLLGEPDGLDGEEAAGDGDDGSAAKEVREALGVERGGGDDDAEVGAAGEGALEQAEEEVDVEGALVGLVDDEGGVAAEEGVVAGLGQEDAVGHQLEARLGGGLALEAVLVAHGHAEGRADLLGQATGHGDGRQAARLGDADHPAGLGAGQVGELGELGGLAAARVAADDGDGAPTERLDQFVRVRGDGQFWRDGQAIHAGNYSKTSPPRRWHTRRGGSGEEREENGTRASATGNPTSGETKTFRDRVRAIARRRTGGRRRAFWRDGVEGRLSLCGGAQSSGGWPRWRRRGRRPPG